MCGIIGYYCFGEKRPEKDEIGSMLALASSRGTDASGWAFIKDGRLNVFKAPISSIKLITTKSWKQLEMPKIFIAHTRAGTQGSEKINGNNHPIFNKNGMAIIHNGMISNEHEVYKKFEITPDNEVDSEVILRLMEAYKEPNDMIKNVFDHVEGSYAVASVDKDNPERLILFRSLNPIKLVYDTETEILYFASEADYISKSLPKEERYSKHGINFYKNRYEPIEFNDEYAMVIENKVTLYQKYTPKPQRVYGRYSSYYSHKSKGYSYYDDEIESILEANCSVCGEDVLSRVYPYTIRNNGSVWCSKCRKMTPWEANYGTHVETFGAKDSERIYGPIKKMDQEEEMKQLPF